MFRVGLVFPLMCMLIIMDYHTYMSSHLGVVINWVHKQHMMICSMSVHACAGNQGGASQAGGSGRGKHAAGTTAAGQSCIAAYPHWHDEVKYNSHHWLDEVKYNSHQPLSYHKANGDKGISKVLGHHGKCAEYRGCMLLLLSSCFTSERMNAYHACSIVPPLSVVLILSCMMQEATAQLHSAQDAEQPISLQIVVLDDSSSHVAATLTPAKTCSPPQGSAAAELQSAIQHAAQGLISSELDMPSLVPSSQPDCLSVPCTPAAKLGQPADVCATPEARAAAAQLLRGLGMTQSLSLELGFDLEPEWPTCPPPSLAASPLMASAPGSPLVLPAELVRTLAMGTGQAWTESNSVLEPELSSNSLDEDASILDNPRAPHPTPSASHGGRPCASSDFTLDAEDIIAAFSLAHEQLRVTSATAKKQTEAGLQSVATPMSFAPLQSQEAAEADEVSPVVKTTRQVSSVLAAVAELEAAQGVTGKRNVKHPFTIGASRFLPPSSAESTPASASGIGASRSFLPGSIDRTPANKVSTQFFRTSGMDAAASAEPLATAAATLSHVANPLFGQSDTANLANPLFSPLASSSPDPMLTPFYTPASMSSIRTGLETPASRSSLGGKENLAVDFGRSPAGLATPVSGVVAGDWRSVTDRLQALRAQLQSAQKKLKATTQVGLVQLYLAFCHARPLQQV